MSRRDRDLTFGDDVPEWLRREARYWAGVLGLGDVDDLHVCLSDVPCDNPNWRGSCSVNEPQGFVHIELKRGRSDDDTSATLLHEMVHAVLARLDWQMTKRVVPLVPKPQRRLAFDLYTDANEATVVKLTRALMRLLPRRGGEP